MQSGADAAGWWDLDKIQNIRLYLSFTILRSTRCELFLLVIIFYLLLFRRSLSDLRQDSRPDIWYMFLAVKNANQSPQDRAVSELSFLNSIRTLLLWLQRFHTGPKNQFSAELNEANSNPDNYSGPTIGHVSKMSAESPSKFSNNLLLNRTVHVSSASLLITPAVVWDVLDLNLLWQIKYLGDKRSAGYNFIVKG